MERASEQILAIILRVWSINRVPLRPVTVALNLTLSYLFTVEGVNGWDVVAAAQKAAR